MMAKYRPSEDQLRWEKRRDEALKLATIHAPRLIWHGRGLHWDADEQAIEQERQRWVEGTLNSCNELTQAMAVDPDREYAVHRQAYEDTGDLWELDRMLDYVRL